MMPGDVVMSPCAGIGSEGYVAVGMDRKAVMIELKESYFHQLCLNLKRAEMVEKQQAGLFEVHDEAPVEETADAV